MKRKKKKPTKTAIEFNKIKKRIREQERYYSKRGFDIVSVSDTFYDVKPTRSTLAELKRYEKQWKQKVKDIKKAASIIKKEKGVSTSVAYKYLAARDQAQAGNVLKFEDVVINAFYEKINQFPNFQSRLKMGGFIARLTSLVGSEETARILANTAENEQDFEAVLQYNTDDIALYNTYQLMQTIVDQLSESEYPISKQELQDFIDSIES